MKRMAIALAAAISLSLAAPAFAQGAKAPEGIFIAAQAPDQHLAGDTILNAKVVGAEGKIIGDIEDLILNEYNQVVGVIMGVGGFLGLGEKRVAVRYSALNFKNEAGKTTVSLPTVTRDVLKAMPAFKRSRPAKTFLERVQERAKELAAKTTATTSDAYEKAKQNAGPAYEEAKRKAKEAYEKAKEAYENTLKQKPQQ